MPSTRSETDHVEEPIKNENERIRCQNCDTARMFSDRYRCLECEKYDLCGICFDQRAESRDHRAYHAMIYLSERNEIFGEKVVDTDHEITLENFRKKYASSINEDIQCKYCHIKPIKGMYFKCDCCLQYYLCFNCMKIRAHHPSHTLLAMSDHRLTEIPLVDIELLEEIGRGGFGK